MSSKTENMNGIEEFKFAFYLQRTSSSCFEIPKSANFAWDEHTEHQGMARTTGCESRYGRPCKPIQATNCRLMKRSAVT
eukprot:5593730-Pleurochrysis_carterae.AAC.1